MATINASSAADIIVPSNGGTTYRGLGGDDTYIISNAASGNITIVDTNGSNTIQLVDGLSIASSKFAADSVQLTLSSGAVLTVNGADKFTFEVGGNDTSGVTGSDKTYADLAADMGVASLPTGSTITDGSGGTISGTGIASGATGYSLSASATSVAEGSAITYTVTANAAVTADTTLTYNVIGSDNDGTVDKATGSDVSTQSGTVTIASGETTATFTVTAEADNDAEGLEGISVSVFDPDLNVIGTKKALISNNADLETTVQNLTTGTDEAQGGGGKDTIGAAIGTNQTIANGTTFNPGDVIDGKAGSDTLKISIAGTHTGGAKSHTGVTVSNVETIEVNNFETSANGDIINMSLMSGVTSLGLASSSSTGATTFTGVAAIADAFVKSGAADMTVTYAAAASAGLADVQNLTASGTTAGTVTIAGVETLNLIAGAAKATLAAVTTTSATAATISGDTKLTVTGALEGGIKSIDGSESTGGFDIQLNPDSIVTVTGGSGNDTVNVAGNLDSLFTLDGGDGTDTIEISDASDITITNVAGISSFETLSATGLDADDYDADLISGITKLVAAAASGANDVTFKNVTAANSDVLVTGTEGVILTLKVDGSADSVDVEYRTALGGGLTVAGQTNVTQYETVNITNGSLIGAVDTGAVTNASTTAMTFKGSQGITLGTSSSTVLSSVDASEMTGTTGLTMTSNSGTVLFPSTIIGSPNGTDTLIGGSAADTISGGGGIDQITGAAGADIIKGEAGNDIIDGGAGVDNIDGGAGKDQINVSTVTDFISLATPETVDGGEGTDTLSFTENTATTISNTDLHNLKNIEIIEFDGNNTANITLDDTFFTSNGTTSIKIKDMETSAALTVSAATVSAANSIDVTANSANGINESLTGGAGDDIFRFSTLGNTAALDASDTVNGGAGTDTLAITAATNNMAAASLTLVSNVEKITVTALGTETAGVTIVDGIFVTTATATVNGVFDASSSTGTGAITFDGSAEDDSTMTITGGNGADILTGGVKADIISGGSGVDTITGGSGIDTLIGGAGNDIFNMDDVSDFIGLVTAETIDGGAGVLDTILFDENAVTTVAASDLANISGIERISFGGTSTNSLTLSNDVYTNNGSTTLTILDSDTAGATTVSAAGLSSANSVTYKNIAASGTTDSVTTGAGDDLFETFEDSLVAADVFAAGAGTDTLKIKLDGGNLGATTLTNVSKIENITLTTDATARTADITLVDANFQAVAGTINASTMTGALTLDASVEDDSSLTINAGVGNDIITGTDKTTVGDTISGGTGTDTIEGSKGGDIITGGAGADTFVYRAVADSSGSTPDSILDFVSKTDQFSIIADYSANNAAITVNATVLTGVASKTAAQDSLTGQRLEVIYDTGTSQAYINVNNDNLITSLDYTIGINAGAAPKTTVATTDFDFTITGTSQADVITSGGGDDTIDGGSGADTINAGAGTNTVSDSAGADQVTGGNSGVDTINVSTGSDDVSYSSITDALSLVTITNTTSTADDFTATAGTTVDSITNFATGADEIDILGTLNAALDAVGAADDTAAAVANGADLDFDAAGVFVLGSDNNAADDLAGDNFGDVSAVVAAFAAASGTAANSAANDQILFSLGNNSGNAVGLYYFQDVDGNNAISVGDKLALLAIASAVNFAAADFNFV